MNLSVTVFGTARLPISPLAYKRGQDCSATDYSHRHGNYIPLSILTTFTDSFKVHEEGFERLKTYSDSEEFFQSQSEDCVFTNFTTRVCRTGGRIRTSKVYLILMNLSTTTPSVACLPCSEERFHHSRMFCLQQI